MIIGIPKEIKIFEFRVATSVEAVQKIVELGHTVLIEKSAGLGSGWTDRDYRVAGAKILSSKRELFKKSDLILKVKEPQPSEYPLLRPGLILFTFLHLAANKALARVLLKKKVSVIAYENVQTDSGTLPILAPMSEIAGKLAPLMGANFLRKDLGGKGILLSAVGLGGTGHVTILGAGHAGSNALKMAHGLGASISIYDVNCVKLESLRPQYSERLQIVSDPSELPEILKRTDLLIGAALIPGKRAPHIATTSMVRLMERGSVIIDISVDQGGCIETTRPTTLKDPVFLKHGVLHCGVTNLPSLVPRSASEALCGQTLPYVLKIVRLGLKGALEADASFKRGLMTEEIIRN